MQLGTLGACVLFLAMYETAWSFARQTLEGGTFSVARGSTRSQMALDSLPRLPDVLSTSQA